MEKELTIIVAGGTCMGKSNMMFYLQQQLMKEGFTVEMNFEGADYKDEADFRKHMNVNLDERQRLLKDMTKITLKEMQMPRDTKQNTSTEVKG